MGLFLDSIVEEYGANSHLSGWELGGGGLLMPLILLFSMEM
jgi:hypothetical protein